MHGLGGVDSLGECRSTSLRRDQLRRSYVGGAIGGGDLVAQGREALARSRRVLQDRLGPRAVARALLLVDDALKVGGLGLRDAERLAVRRLLATDRVGLVGQRLVDGAHRGHAIDAVARDAPVVLRLDRHALLQLVQQRRDRPLVAVAEELLERVRRDGGRHQRQLAEEAAHEVVRLLGGLRGPIRRRRGGPRFAGVDDAPTHRCIVRAFVVVVVVVVV